MKIKILFLLVVLTFENREASAFDIAIPGTEGLPVIVASNGPVIATYEGNSAGFSNDLFLERNSLGAPGLDGNTSNDLFIFNNHESPVGSILNLGEFSEGEELIFRLFVRDTGESFFSGGTPNPDELSHARVQNNWQPGKTLVSFEDLYGLPEGVGGYNDLSFSFTNTRNTVEAVPESGSTLISLCLALPGLLMAARRFRSGKM